MDKKRFLLSCSFLQEKKGLILHNMNKIKCFTNLLTEIDWYFRPTEAITVLIKFIIKKNPTRHDVNITFVQYSFYWGMSPIYYDYKSKIFRTKKGVKGLFCYILCMSLLSICFITALVSQNNVIYDPYLKKSSKTLSVLHVIIVAVCYNTLIHTGFRRYQIVQSINGYSERMETLSRSNTSTTILAEKLMKYAVFNIVAITIWGPIATLYDCRLHLMSSFMPVCGTKEQSSNLLWSPLIPLFYILSVFNISMELSTMGPYSPLILSLVFDGRYIFGALFNDDNQKNVNNTGYLNQSWRPSLRKKILLKANVELAWLILYRSCQILGKAIDRSLGQYFLPILLSQITIFTIINNYILIGLENTIPFKSMQILANISVVLYFNLLKRCSYFSSLSENAVRTKILRHPYMNLYSIKVLNTCRPIPITVGSYFKFSANLILGIYGGILQYTTTLVIAMRN